MKKIYFLSDAHLGSKTFDNPLENERRLVRFLDSIKEDAKAIYLLGDIIDFWYEYKTVVPRGFTRFFGKIAELTDRGIEVHWFAGNHDIWMFDYLPQEIGVILHHQPMVTQINGKKLFLAHGDGLGDDSKGYKLMSGFFRNKFCQRLFSAIHPRWTVAFAHKWSQHSRLNGSEFDAFLGEDKEHLVKFSRDYLQTQKVDYFIFGHRHIMLDLMLSRESRILILGDWVNHFSFAVMEGEDLWLEQFEEETAERTDAGPNVSIAF
ncbi:MAG: UDP-2,3-diacylglucosamine diphosphatase [Bacteroidales bacterium]